MHYELQQFLQEQTREALGAPFGRAPPITSYSCLFSLWLPIKLYDLSENSPRMRLTDVSPRGVPSAFRSYNSPRRSREDSRRGECFTERVFSPSRLEPISPRSRPLPRFPATSTALNTALDSLPPDYQFTTPSSDELASFNPFRRPKAENYFFPTDMFMEEDLRAVAETLPVSGMGKWRKSDYSYEWRPCEVLSVDAETRRFTVQWSDTSAQQELMRWNLLLGGETEQDLERKLARSKTLRMDHESFVRYFSRFELALARTKQRQTAAFRASEAAILAKIAHPRLSRDAAKVREELWELYRRSTFKFVFDSQYFYEKAQLAACPWEASYAHQMKWLSTLRSRGSPQRSFRSSQRAILDSFLNPKNPLDGPRQRVYRRLTALRNGNYYESLRLLRSLSDTLSPSKLSYEFRDKFSSDLHLIDTTVKQIVESLSKLIDEGKAVDTEVDRYLRSAQVVLESNIEYAVRNSTQTLVDTVREYYPVLPLPGEERCQRAGDMAASLLPDVRRRHFTQSASPSMSLVESLQLSKDVCEVLDADFRSGKLSRYALEKVVPPLVAVTIESKLTQSLANLGQPMKFFHVVPSLSDRPQRRSKVLTLSPSSHSVVRPTSHSQLLAHLTQQIDECALLAEETQPAPFGWVTAGNDQSLILSPSIPEIETALQMLAKAPLKNLQRIRKLKRSATETEHITARNAKSCLKTALEEIGAVLQLSLYGPVSLLAILRHFEYLFTPDPAKLLRTIVESHIDDYVGFVTEVETIASHRDTIEHNLPNEIQFGIFQVHLRNFKVEAVTNANILMEALLSELSCEHLGILREVHSSFESLRKTLNRSPDSVEALGELQDFLALQQDETLIEDISEELDKVKFIADSLERFNTPISDEQNILWWKTKSWSLRIKHEKSRLSKRISKLIPAFKDAVQRDISELKCLTERLKTDIVDFVTYSDVQKADVYAGKAAEIMEMLKSIKSNVTVANSRERRLGYQSTNFSELVAMEEQFLVFNALWTFANEWSISYMSWMDKPLHLVDPAIVKGKYRKGRDLIERLKNDLRENPNATSAVEDLNHQLRAFESTVPLIGSLREEALKERHWKRIWEVLNRPMSEKSDIERRETQTLRELLLQGILKHVKLVESVSLEAKNEYEVEKVWVKIEREVRNPSIEVKTHPVHSDLLLLDAPEEMQDSLHEAATTINFLTNANRFIEPFKDNLKNLTAMITAQKTMVDDVCDFQSMLVELYPIFKIAEVCEQLPRTAVQMQELVQYYSRQLKFMLDTHNLATSMEGSVKTLSDAFSQLKSIKEDVDKKVAEKQSLNSRLYFLSNVQILTLMSSVAAKAKIDVEDLFPGIEEAILGEKAIEKVVRNTEVIALPKTVVVLLDGNSPRSIEEWLSDLESSLRDFHSKRIADLYRQFAGSGLVWDVTSDNEAVYIAYWAWFTRLVTCALLAPSAKSALMAVQAALKSALAAGVAVMKPSHGTPGHGNITTIVRNQFLRRDATLSKKNYNEMLAHLLMAHIDFLEQVTNTHEEDLRFYWKAALKLTPQQNNSPDAIHITVDCFDFAIPYGFEMHSLQYLQAFILTPLSERRLVHVFLTMKRGLGCMLSGVPGSEKAETLKHLALVCGRLMQLCYITSNTLQEKVVKFMVGCAMGGFWGCIVEIQSLPPVSLCTVLHYIKQISAGVLQSSRVMIDSYQVKPKLGFCVFATCSSSPASLPSTFHEPFRTLAVSKPDLSTIACILMETYGFESAKRYGRLIAKAMEVMEQPIVSFASGTTLNLRTKATTRTLIRLVRSMIEIALRHYINDMEYLVNNAFRQVYGLGLLSRDLEVLDEYLGTLFQSTHNDLVSQIKSRSITEQILQVLALEKVTAEEAMQWRCQHLWWLLCGAKRPWVFVVGESLSGKSKVIKLLAKVIAALNGTNFRVHTLGADAPVETLLELYEYIANSRNPWFPSTISSGVCSSSCLPGDCPSSPLDWIHIDCHSFPYTADALFTLIKTFPKTEVKLVFETDRIDSASPGVICESGVLYIEDGEIDLLSFFRIRAREVLTGDLQPYLQLMDRLFHSVLTPVLSFLSTSGVTLRLSPKGQIQQFANMFQALVAMLVERMTGEKRTKTIPLTKEANSLVILKRATCINVERAGKFQKATIHTKNPDLKANVLRYLGGVRRTITTIKPELCLEALFVVSAVHALGRLAVNKDSFATLITGAIFRQTEDFAYSLQKELKEGSPSLISDLVFSVRAGNWMKITTFNPLEELIVANPRTSVCGPRGSVGFDTGGVQLSVFSSNASRHNLLISTESSRRLSYWVEFSLAQHCDFLVFGPHQSGKSVVTMSVAKEMLNRNACSVIAYNVSEFSTAVAAQEAVQTAMEHYRKFAYGGLGGTEYYAVLDDMNMDASCDLYDLFRFWKENGGWYSPTFVSVEDLTVALVHSYTEGKSRPLWPRALRHYLLIYKEEYLETEITAIFRRFIDANAVEESLAPSDMRSVAEESILALVGLFRTLLAQHKKSEQVWCHVSVSNFTMALKFVAQFEMVEDIDIPSFLKMWTFMYNRFFLDQFADGGDDCTSRELRVIVEDSLQALLEKFIEEDAVIREIREEGFMMPTADDLASGSEERFFRQFALVGEDSLAEIVAHFHSNHKKCVEKYPHLLKCLHSLIFQIESRFSAFYHFYLSVLYDLNSACPSVIVKSESQRAVIKALMCIAAETLSVKVVELNIDDSDDALAEYMLDSFRRVSPHHLPTEVKYLLKRLVEEAMIQNQRILLIITLVSARQLTRPIAHHIMELANDIMTGVPLRLTGFASFYRELVEQFRKASDDPAIRSELFNEQVLQMMLDRMKVNTTIAFVVEAENEAWIRSPVHPVGLLEKFKHEFRTVFNRSRVVDFDRIKPPYAFVKYIARNPHLLASWKLDFHNDLLIAIGTRFCALLKQPTFDEFTYECLIHCSARLMKEFEARRAQYKFTFARATQQIEELERAVDSAPRRVSALEQEAAKLEAHVQSYKDRKAKVDSSYAKMLAVDYAAQFQMEIQERRAEVMSVFEQQRAMWTREVSAFDIKYEDVRDLEKAAGSQLALRVLFLFSLLVAQTEATGEISAEQMEQAVRKFTPQLTKKPKDILKKLRKMEAELIPGLQPHVDCLEVGSPRATPRLVKAMQTLLYASQSFREAHHSMTEAVVRFDQEMSEVPKLVESKLREIREVQASKVAVIQAKLDRSAAKLAQVSQEVEQITISRPKLQKFLWDLRSSSEAWSEFLASSKHSTDLEDSILCSLMLMKGMSASQYVRNAVVRATVEVMREQGFSCHSSVSLSARLIASHRTFAAECVRKGLPDSAFFRDNIAALRTIFRLSLPFPLLYDPYEIAVDYISKIENENGLLVGKVSNDIVFERKLRECVAEGRPVLCIDPSQSLLKALMPILTWKAQAFVSLMRNVDVASMDLPFIKGQVRVHPNFRLYISCKTRLQEDVQQVMTQVSFDAEDQDSWEAFACLPLLKLLDEHQYQVYCAFLGKQHDQAVASDEAESEILTLLSQNNMQKVLTSESILDSLFKSWRKMKALPLIPEEETIGKTRRPSLIPVEAKQPAVDLRVAPKEKMKKLLAEMLDLKQTLVVCNPALQDYAVSEKLLHSMVINSVLEYIRTIAVPLESQWDGFADCMAYRVFVRVCHSLPKDKRLIFTAFYAVYKQYQTSSASKTEYLLVLDDIAKANTAETRQSDAIAYLKDRYPHLFSSTFAPGTALFSQFLSREVYSEAKLPENFSLLHRFLFFAYLRKDLLSDFVSAAVELVLGARYLWVPRIDFDLYMNDYSHSPTVVFFEESAPIPLIKYMAEARSITLVHTQPLLESVMRTGKVEIRKVGRAINPIISAIRENLGSSRWIAVENLFTISGLEAEVLTKFLLYRATDDCSGIRIWVVLQGRPESHPQWHDLVKHCQRVVMPEPRTLKEEMLMWHYTNTAAFFTHYRDFVNRRYMEHCSLDADLQVTLRTNFAKGGKRSTVVGQRKHTVTALTPEGRHGLVGSGLAFNLAFVFSVLYYRNRAIGDLTSLWRRADARSLVDDFLSCLPSETQPRDLLKPSVLALFCQLLAPQFDSFAVATIVSVLRQVFQSEGGVLTVQDEEQNFECIEYPLFQMEHFIPENNLELLINKYPAEDHILVTGLRYYRALPQRLSEAHSVLAAVPSLRQAFEGRLAAKLVCTEKRLMSETLQLYIAELLEVLPPVVRAKPLSHSHQYVNAYTKTGSSFKAALAHTQDGFKLSDMRNSVLDSPPRLREVMEVLETAEVQSCNCFLSTVRKALVEMSHYLSYSRSALAANDVACLRELARNRVPDQWLHLSPYVCRQAKDAREWKRQVLVFFRKKLDWEKLDLAALFEPSVVLHSILRAAAVARSQHFEQMGFSVTLGQQLSDDFQIAVCGLYLQSAALCESLLKERPVGESLPVCTLTPCELPKSLRSSPVYPSGLKLWVRSEATPKSDLSVEVNARLCRHPGSRGLRDSDGFSAFVFLPVDVAESPLWLLVASSEPQGFWSRRGTVLRLEDAH